MALSLHLYNVSTQVTDVPHAPAVRGGPDADPRGAAMNAIAIGFRMRLRGRKKW
jgi:hypothetical protein